MRTMKSGRRRSLKTWRSALTWDQYHKTLFAVKLILWYSNSGPYLQHFIYDITYEQAQ